MDVLSILHVIRDIHSLRLNFFHKGAGQFAGNYDEVVAAILNYQRQIEELGNFVLARTKIPNDVFEEHFSTDWYLSAKEAIELGVADGYITSLDEII